MFNGGAPSLVRVVRETNESKAQNSRAKIFDRAKEQEKSEIGQKSQGVVTSTLLP